ncbi:MAG: hypothetical protein ABIG84_04240 [archaeon]
MIKNTTNLLLYINNNPTYRICQTGGEDITPLAYEKIKDNRYVITPPEKKYIVLADTYSDSWPLGASKKLDNQPINIREYTEIQKKSGYVISIITFMYLLLILRMPHHPSKEARNRIMAHDEENRLQGGELLMPQQQQVMSQSRLVLTRPSQNL